MKHFIWVLMSLSFLAPAQATVFTQEQANILTANPDQFGQVSGMNRFRSTYLATPSEIQQAPSITYVVGKEYATVGDTLHITDILPIAVGDVYVIFYQGSAKIDHQTQKLIGYETIAVGEAQVTSTAPEITLKVIEVNGKIKAGNRLLAKVAHDTNNQ